MGLNLGEYADRTISLSLSFLNLHKSKKKILEALKISGINIKVSFNIKNNKNDYRSILKNEKNLSCAVVVVPDHLHYKIVNECLNHNLHTLVVKPFTTKLIEAKKLIKK